MVYNCLGCDGELSQARYESHPKHWCSQTCRHAHIPSEPRTFRVGSCLECASDLVVKRKGNPKKYCSGSCRQKYLRKTNPQYRARVAAYARTKHRETYQPKRYTLKCSECPATFETSNSLRKYCSDACKYRSHYAGRRGRKAGVERERYTRLEIFERDNWTCHICTEPVDPSLEYPDPGYPSIDHVMPLCEGGPDTRDNVKLAHLDCNKKKGPRS